MKLNENNEVVRELVGLPPQSNGIQGNRYCTVRV